MSEENRCSGSCESCEAECGYNDGSATVTLNLDDGTVQECAVIAIYQAENRNHYIALLPLNQEGGNDDGEVYLYRFHEDGGEPTLENIESDEEYLSASEGFDKWLDEREFDDLVYETEEESSNA